MGLCVDELIAAAKRLGSGTTTSADAGDGRCPECRGTGWVLAVRENAMYAAYPDKTETVAERCPRCAPARRRIETRRRSGIPDAFAGLTMKDFRWTAYPEKFRADAAEAERRAAAFVSRFDEFRAAGMGLFIHSKTMGSGKTRLACCLAGELMEKRGVSARFVSASQLLDAVRCREERTDVMAELIDAPLLVLDDVGAKRTGEDWLNDELFRLLDGRMRGRRPTLVTSNFPVSELPVDGHVADRIDAGTLLVRLPEHRVRGAEARQRKEALLRGL